MRYSALGECSVCGSKPESSNYVSLSFEEGLFEYEVAVCPTNASSFTLKLTALTDASVMIGTYDSSLDTWGALYSADWVELVQNDDYTGYEFGIEYKFKAGETYYLVARPLGEGNYGSYTVYANHN